MNRNSLQSISYCYRTIMCLKNVVWRYGCLWIEIGYAEKLSLCGLIIIILCFVLQMIDNYVGNGHQKLTHMHSYHQNHHITVTIPHKQHKNNHNLLQTTPAESQVSIVPLESARIVTSGSKKRRINSEAKFIHIDKDIFDSALSIKRVAKIKNVVFRPKLERFISEEKTRLAALEETLMLQRQRRLNKEECIKKIQRLMSPTNIRQRNSKKFIRTQEKKTEQNKKFKRIKEKEEDNPQQRLIQGKLIKKLREEYNLNNLSGIPEHLDEYYNESRLEQSNPESQIPQLFSQHLGQSTLEQQNGTVLPSFSKK